MACIHLQWFHCKLGQLHYAGNNLPGIASQFAIHFYMTAIQDIFCVAVFLHRSVQNLVWNICLLTEFASQIWRGKLFPASMKLQKVCSDFLARV